MADGPLSHVLEHIRRLAGTGEAADLADKQLLDRFVRRHDEAAFETLLHRHGGLVLGVCRRVLSEPQDIEDAFQATFLVLLRKAGSLRRRELLAAWLYGVAYRTALKARTQAARRRAHESRVPARSAPPTESEVMWRELRPVLDEELNRLPAKYRVPVVLCYLEGKSFTEAARQLGWPAGTVSGRLARARELLRDRLTRRGLALSAGLLATYLTEEVQSASVPAPLRLATLKAALVLTAGKAAGASLLPVSVAALTEGVLHAMFMSKIKIAAGVVLALSVIGGGAGVVGYARLVAQQATREKTEAPKREPAPKPSDVLQLTEEERVELGLPDAKQVDELLKTAYPPGRRVVPLYLLKERFEAARTCFVGRYWEFVAGRGVLEILLEAERSLFRAERDLGSPGTYPGLRAEGLPLKALEGHVMRLKKIEKVNQGRFNEGRIPLMDLAQARFERLDAEIDLAWAKQGWFRPQWVRPGGGGGGGGRQAIQRSR